MSGNTNSDSLGNTPLLEAHFTSLTPEAQAVIVALVSLVAPVIIESTDINDVPLTIAGALGQTANILELYEKIGGTVLAEFDVNGSFFVNDISALTAGNMTIRPFNAASGIYLADSAYFYQYRQQLGGLNLRPFTPAQITADQNDYTNSQYASALMLSSNAAHNITGFVQSPAGVASNIIGDSMLFINVGANNIVLKHLDAGSSAGNQFRNSTGADITLAAGEGADLIYNGTNWSVFKK